MKRQNIYKGFLDFESEFSHRYACWLGEQSSWLGKNESIQQTSCKAPQKSVAEK